VTLTSWQFVTVKKWASVTGIEVWRYQPRNKAGKTVSKAAGGQTDTTWGIGGISLNTLRKTTLR